MSRRADFPPAVRKIIAERAGYQCSVLNCGRLTIGPAPDGSATVRTGMAAHIFAAAPNGPRGTGGLSPAERSEPENGIWCCYTHGKAIDSESGSLYSATQLKAWKRLHEARKGAEVTGVASDSYGLVELIRIDSAPASLAGRTFNLGMRNIITGPNASGKSVLTRLIASVSHPDHVAKMSRRQDVDIAVKWFDPNNHDVATSGRAGEVSHVLDGRSVPYVARPYKTILLSLDTGDSLEHIASLAQMLDLNIASTKALLRLLPEASDVIREIQIVGDRVEWVLNLQGRLIRETRPSHLPALLSAQLLVELASAHARHHARVEPTFLLIDGLFGRFHDMNVVRSTLERLESAAEHAQVAVVTASRQVADCATDWTIAELEGGRGSEFRCPVDFEVQTTLDIPGR
ncbi:hypothetical protein KBX08_11420 [Micromonospora sp. H61]|uniref:hypothetical protein n=1 Tax=Micromonospora sp. H61 TaxID=2824888 RepID=UPI001B37939E|nr:hypothetical protein [Micromonospora sp. H61]MBQ0990699.1 hypothetical protein [Micromonospora sp. H61]